MDAAPLAWSEQPAWNRGAGGITAEQRLMLQEKLSHVATLLRTAHVDQPGSQVSPDQRRWLMERMLSLPLGELRGIAAVASATALGDALNSAHARVDVRTRTSAKALGDLATELVFIPIAPCRFVDTRVTGGQIPNNGSRGYDLDQTGMTYGGSGSCDPSATVGGNANQMGAIFINVTAIGSPFAPGFLGVRPTGSGNVTSLVNWYESGATVQAANAAIVPINQATINDEIEFFGTQTHVVVDVMGVFAAPTPTALQCVTGTLVPLNIASAGIHHLDAGGCPTGYTISATSCQIVGTGDTANLYQLGGGVVGTNSTRCTWRYQGASNVQVTNTPWCCRLPGR